VAVAVGVGLVTGAKWSSSEAFSTRLLVGLLAFCIICFANLSRLNEGKRTTQKRIGELQRLLGEPE